MQNSKLLILTGCFSVRVVKQISQVRWATASLPGFQKAPVLSGCPVGDPGRAPRRAVSAGPAWAGLGGPCRGAAVCTEMGCLGPGLAGRMCGAVYVWMLGTATKGAFWFCARSRCPFPPGYPSVARIAGRVTLHPTVPLPSFPCLYKHLIIPAVQKMVLVTVTSFAMLKFSSHTGVQAQEANSRGFTTSCESKLPCLACSFDLEKRD